MLKPIALRLTSSYLKNQIRREFSCCQLSMSRVQFLTPEERREYSLHWCTKADHLAYRDFRIFFAKLIQGNFWKNLKNTTFYGHLCLKIAIMADFEAKFGLKLFQVQVFQFVYFLCLSRTIIPIASVFNPEVFRPHSPSSQLGFATMSNKKNVLITNKGSNTDGIFFYLVGYRKDAFFAPEEFEINFTGHFLWYLINHLLRKIGRSYTLMVLAKNTPNEDSVHLSSKCY